MNKPFVAIVDYGLGNLFSVQQACKKVSLTAIITSSPDEIFKSSGIILTGVGAFGEAMEMLVDKGLVDVLRNNVLSGKPLMGICLGMQVLMTESYEFGRYPGLDIIEGQVFRLKTTLQESRVLKVPHVGWSRIHSRYPDSGSDTADDWQGTLLEEIPDGAQMYFVHSYFVEPAKKEIVLSKTRYGDNEFCSGIRFSNVSAFQFHPECSGPYGLTIYKNFANQVFKKTTGGIYV